MSIVAKYVILTNIIIEFAAHEGHVNDNDIHSVIICVAPPILVGTWSMAVLLGQRIEYY